jgi:hypothetical protein
MYYCMAATRVTIASAGASIICATMSAGGVLGALGRGGFEIAGVWSKVALFEVPPQFH